MIILRPWTNYSAFVVIVILIDNIPIQPVMKLNSQPCFRRLIRHRIRCDQRSGNSGRISHSISLAVILVDAIGGKQRHSRSDTTNGLYEEEVIPHKIQAVTRRVLNAIEEVIDYSLTVYPVIVIAAAH